jgi:hypothetical protein
MSERPLKSRRRRKESLIRPLLPKRSGILRNYSFANHSLAASAFPFAIFPFGCGSAALISFVPSSFLVVAVPAAIHGQKEPNVARPKRKVQNVAPPLHECCAKCCTLSA